MTDDQLQGQFVVSLVWAAMQKQLAADLGNEVMVDSISKADFDEEGYLTVRKPAARVLFAEGEAGTPIENQGLNYRPTLRFGVICADEYYGADPQGQRDRSLLLAGKVSLSLVGARLVLGDGTTSDPVLWTGIRPLPTAEGDMAYVVGFDVVGTAQFPGTHAVPSQPEIGQNNG